MFTSSYVNIAKIDRLLKNIQDGCGRVIGWWGGTHNFISLGALRGWNKGCIKIKFSRFDFFKRKLKVFKTWLQKPADLGIKVFISVKIVFI
jgi:hypothetical protein